MKQAANLNFEIGIYLPGTKIKTSPTDFAPLEQLQMMRFKGESWELFGPLMSGGESRRALTLHCERSESISRHNGWMDCFVASLLAMTGGASVTSPPAPRPWPAAGRLFSSILPPFSSAARRRSSAWRHASLQSLDLPVGGIEFLLMVQRKPVDGLLQEIDIALQATGAPFHGLFDVHISMPGNILRIAASRASKPSAALRRQSRVRDPGGHQISFKTCSSPKGVHHVKLLEPGRRRQRHHTDTVFRR